MEFAAGLQILLDDSALRAKMGGAAAARALREHGLDAASRVLDDALRKVVG